MEFIINNKEWIFSGVGLFLISAGVAVFRKKSASSTKSIKTSGHGSPIIIGNNNQIKNEKKF